jgi:uncharacterized membrane protein YbhN (UPF0104 family)
VLTLVWTFHGVDPRRVLVLVASIGGGGVLILLPQLLSLLVESFGWQLAFGTMGERLPLLGLFRARLATEALAQTLPAGVVFCESMKPLLLARTCGAPLSTSLAGMAARKWLLVVSQSLYVGGFAVLGWSALRGISVEMTGGGGLSYALLGAAGLLLALDVTSYGLLAHGRVASRLFAALSRIPSTWLRARLSPLESRCAHTDGQMRRFFENVLRSPWPVLAFACGWLLEAAETLLILYLLGVRLPWTTIGAVEVSSSFLRNVAFMVPAGLGVQDLSYVTFFRALHLPDALELAAAFLLLKRCKECFWAAIGYVILAFDLRPLQAPKPVEQTC